MCVLFENNVRQGDKEKDEPSMKKS